MSILYPYQRPASEQLIRALTHGEEEWGYPGCADLSDVGIGKSFIDLSAALATGRSPAIVCPMAGIQGWMKTLKAFNASAHYLGTPEGLKTGGRHEIVARHLDTFTWKNASSVILILDEAQHFKGMDSLASRLADGAIAQKIPMICASATLASSPLELRIAGQITGLHTGGQDWERFLEEWGCEYDDEEMMWKWKRKKHALEQLHHKLIPMRGCRVTKADMGQRPTCRMDVLPIHCEEGAYLAEEWRKGQEDLNRLYAKRYPAAIVTATRRKIRMRLWKLSEMALAKPLAERMKQDLAEGKSVVAFFQFTDTREQVGKLLKTNDGFYGGQNPAQRAYLENEFQADRIRVLLNQIKAGGSSVSLHDTRGDYPRVAYVLPSDSAVAMGQAPGRIDRAGMVTEAQVWFPCVAGTLSEGIVRSTAKKISQMNKLNDGAA